MSENIWFLTGDARTLGLPDNSVDLIITNPPYFGEEPDRWGGDSSEQINATSNAERMLDLLLEATDEMFRVLKPGGNLFIANSAKDRFDIKYVYNVMQSTEFRYLDVVLQNSYNNMGPGEPPFQTIDRNCVTYWYHFRKPGGLTTDDMEFLRNEDYGQAYNNPVWNLHRDNCQSAVDQEMGIDDMLWDTLNEELAERIINLFTLPGESVLDPFGGSGVVGVTAAKLGRIGINNDIIEEQTKRAELRWSITERIMKESSDGITAA